ncbi:MAG: C40 family peptidase [Nitrosomonas sp.]|jgi:lipoprotein Spr/probable lipoprotein NlpC|nr:C40 family peptidase [Nitrosomonas sp.]MBK7364096.1 C40 family peptidase [Nitrosomonas sp.]
MSIKYISVLIVFCCFVVGCGTVSQREQGLKQSRIPNSSFQTDSHGVKGKLYAKYRQWEGVPYQWGGLSRSGIDCSGFVHIIYKRELGKILPRTTELQARVGRHVDINSLKAGDLVFFRIGNNARHVGIYLENRRFMHASRSRGVTISKLDHRYWKSRYWKSIRV